MRRLSAASACVLCLLIVLAGADAAHAASPFGVATPDSTGGGFGGPLGPVFAWIALRQAEFYKALTAALSGIKENGAAVWLLLGLSFAYGVFHAAGPGHGKAVITSYLVASGESVRRGVAISFAAALVQAVVAVLIVTVASIIFRATAVTMTATTDWIEIGSYALIAAVGAWLLWTKTFGGGHHRHHHHHHGEDGRVDRHDHDHDHDHQNQGHHADHHHDHDHTAHGHGEAAHGRNPDDAARAPAPGWLARPWSAIMAVGIRPCSGAIIVLVFALSQGLFAAGIAATLVMAVGTGLTVAALATIAVSAKGFALRLAGAEEGGALWVLRGVEIAGAAVVLLFGLLLLGGALSAGLPG